MIKKKLKAGDVVEIVDQNKTRYVPWRFGTGRPVPKGAMYLTTVKNGLMNEPGRPEGYEYVWHYFLVEVDEHDRPVIPVVSAKGEEDHDIE